MQRVRQRRRRRPRSALPVAIVAVALALTGLGAQSGAASASQFEPTGALPSGWVWGYNDHYRGWPVAPVFEQHPIRGSFQDPRPDGIHMGVDIAVRDDQPEADAPPGHTHRVYAIESGIARMAGDVQQVSCTNRRVSIGHFQYWHVDPTVPAGARVRAGDAVGWTCAGSWHMHLSELWRFGAHWAYVNPLHAGGKLAPLTDTAPPRIAALRVFAPADDVWHTDDAARWSLPAGLALDSGALHGLVDVRALIDDPQSYVGWLGELPQLAVALHPYRVHVTIAALADGRVVRNDDVFRNDLGADATGVAMDDEYAPDTHQTLPAQPCLAKPGVDCSARLWFRLFGSASQRYWNTAAVPDGAYRITVDAYDVAGNATSQQLDVATANGSSTFTEAAVSRPTRRIHGTPLDDPLPGTTADDHIWGGAGRDLVYGAGGDDHLFGGAGRDTLLGQEGNDVLVGGAGHDRLDGGTGDDLVDARDHAGGDLVLCGPGRDTAFVDPGDRTRGCETVVGAHR